MKKIKVKQMSLLDYIQREEESEQFWQDLVEAERKAEAGEYENVSTRPMIGGISIDDVPF